MADKSSNSNVSLREAVFRSLRAQGGLQLLREPPRLLGCVLDLVDPDAQTTRVLRRNCNEEFLRPFVEGADAGTTQALHDAAMRATGILVQNRFIQPDIAERVACEVSLAICDFVGVSPSDRVRAAAARDSSGGGMPGAEGGGASSVERGHADAGRPVEPEPEPQPEPKSVAEPQPQREDIGGASVSGVERGYAHTGSPIEPEPRVGLGGRVLEEGRDYRLRYRDNVGGRSGTSQGYIDIEGIGGYRGTKSVPFAIEAKGGRKSPLLVAVAAIALVAPLVVVFLRGSLSGRHDVEAVSAGAYHTVGLLKDGTVVATGWNDKGECDVSGWHDVETVSAGDDYTVALLGDGTVVATGDNYYGQCDVSGWHDVTAVSAGGSHTVALLGDGTVVATGSNTLGQCDVSGWRDVAAASAGWNHTVGLLGDGTVVATGAGDYEGGTCDVSGWHDVVAVSAGWNHTVGLLKDGTVVATGNNEHGKCHVSGW